MPRARSTAAILSAIVLIALASWSVHHEARDHHPNHFADSIVFLETARQPFAIEQLFYPKPIVTPAIYRALDADDVSIQRFQQQFSLIAWSLLGLTLVLCVRRKRARVAGTILGFAFLLAPYRLGFASTILSESINDSLTALLAAAAIALATASARLPAGRCRSVVCGALTTVVVVISTAWIGTRDTNAITAVIAVVCSAAVWRLHRRFRRDRWGLVLAVLVIGTGVFALWTSGVKPHEPTHLSLHEGWPEEVLARTSLSLTNNVFDRILPSRRATRFFVDHGMPQRAELQGFRARWDSGDRSFFTDPAVAPVRRWIASHGSSTFARWLLHHPIMCANELAAHLWDVITPRTLADYMPDGWHPAHRTPLSALAELTTSELCLLALLLAAPWFLRWPRQSALSGVALVTVIAAVAGTAASYYGDTLEIERHCYGSGQQLVLGLWLALIAFLDRQRQRTQVM